METTKTPTLSKTVDSVLLKAYAEALQRKQKSQRSIERLIREVLGLEADQPFDPTVIPSAEEIREEINRYIPKSESLSDLLVAMREAEV